MGMPDRIKERRLAMGYTQEELAEKLGLQKSAIAKYENGRVENIKRSTIEKMAIILECNPAYLMGWDNSQMVIPNNGISQDLNEFLSDFDYKRISIKTGIDICTIKKELSSEHKFISTELLSQIAIALNIDITDLVRSDIIHPGDYINLISTYDDLRYGRLKELYDSLNHKGKEKAILDLEDLSIHPKYARDEQKQETINAAHARTDIDIPEDVDTSEDDIMDNDDNWK